MLLKDKNKERVAELEAVLLEIEQQMLDDADRHEWEQSKFNSICDKHEQEVKILEAKVQQLTAALAQQAALTPPAPIVVKKTKPTFDIKHSRRIFEQELANQPALQLQMMRNRFRIERNGEFEGTFFLHTWLDDNCSGLYVTHEDPNSSEICSVAFELEEDWALFKLKFHGANNVA